MVCGGACRGGDAGWGVARGTGRAGGIHQWAWLAVRGCRRGGWAGGRWVLGRCGGGEVRFGYGGVACVRNWEVECMGRRAGVWEFFSWPCGGCGVVGRGEGLRGSGGLGVVCSWFRLFLPMTGKC